MLVVCGADQKRVEYTVIPEMKKIVGDSGWYTVRGVVVMNKNQPSFV